ncbi:hypothetical protein [Alistipes sp.]|uniref:hypothetical protein n=1 Tax=Alistipes sp. TaxID=1872444 RepID=UPI003AF09A65
MKWKFYLWTFATALAALAVTSGCSSSDDPDDPIPPPTPTDQYSFSVSVSDVKANSALVTVTPDAKSTQATWYCSVVDKATFDKFADDKAYLADDLAYLKKQAENEKLTLENYLKAKIETGTKAVPFTLLDPSTDYYAYVYGITTAGVVTSPLAKYAFKTEAGSVGPDQLTFEIVVSNITKFTADIQVTPSNDNDTYYFDYAPVTAFAGKTDAEFIALVSEDLEAEYLSKGKDGLPTEFFDENNLEPGTEYYVYAFGYDMQKGATTGLTKEKFTTEEATGEAPEVTITSAQGDPSGANPTTKLTFTVYAPGSVSALAVAAKKSDVDALLAKGNTLDELVTYNGDPLSAEDLAALVVQPGKSITYIELTPGTEYSFLFKARGEGGKSTVKRADATTATGGGPVGDLTFTITTDNATTKGFDVSIVPSDLTAPYFWGVFSGTLVDNYAGRDAELIAAIIAGNMPPSGDFSEMCDTGLIEDSFSTLKPNTEYAVICFGYANGAATTGTTSTKISTLAEKPKDPVNSPLFDELPGEWTATITTVDDQGQDEQSTFDLTIAGGVDDNTQPIYRAQNWLVGYGSIYFQNFYTPAALVEAGWPAADAILDYGPKIFFEIAEGDVVTVLADKSNYFLNWNTGSLGEVYLLGLDPVSTYFNYADGNVFPVTVSADKNTLTINPLTIDGAAYYPSILGQKSTGWVAHMIGKSAMTLTRKTGGTTSVKASGSKFGNLRPVRSSAASAVSAAALNRSFGVLSSVMNGSVRNARPVDHLMLREISTALEAGSASVSLKKAVGELHRPQRSAVRTPRR